MSLPVYRRTLALQSEGVTGLAAPAGISARRGSAVNGLRRDFR
jgi:hypothetical protein